MINYPSLVGSVVAVPEGQVLVVPIVASPDIKALLTIVSKISNFAWVVAQLLELFSLPLPYDSSVSN